MKKQIQNLIFLCLVFLLLNGQAFAAGKRLVFSNWLPPGAGLSKAIDQWAAEFSSQTNGRYFVEVIHGGALASIPKSYDVLVNGIADFSHIIPQDTSKPFPISEIPSLPFTGAPIEATVKAWFNAIFQAGYLEKEYSEIKLLYIWPGMVDNMGTVNPINSIEDLKGVKIATGGGPCRPKLLKQLGAIPVFIPPTEVTPMLDKGTVEGIYISLGGIYDLGWDHYLKYKINPLDMFYVVHVIAMNRNTYDSLPADVKAILDKMSADVNYPIALARAHASGDAIGRWLTSTGKEIDWSAKDKARLDEIAGPLWDEWINKMEKRGIQVRQPIEAYYNALKEQGVEKPTMGYQP